MRKNLNETQVDISRTIRDLPELRPLFFKRPDSEKLFGIPPRVLEDLAMAKNGPPYCRRGKYAIYEVESFVEWLTENPVLTTND
jgi:hypothetical protein